MQQGWKEPQTRSN